MNSSAWLFLSARLALAMLLGAGAGALFNQIWIGIALSSLGTLVMLYAAYRAFRALGVKMNDYASLPALLVAMAIFDFFSAPVANSLTRIQEHNADIYGLEVIHGLVPDSQQAAAEAFQIMGEIGLADPSPSPFIEFEEDLPADA